MIQEMNTAYLLIGDPKAGKTTTIKKIIDIIGVEHCGGFYTEEIRNQETRIGFRLVTLDGHSGILAHVNYAGPIRVGRYGVNLDFLESIGVATIYEAMATKDLIVIDEIGPMELHSDKFKRMIMDVLNCPQPLLATIASRSNLWLDTIKQHRSVELYQLTLDNRNNMVDKLTLLLKTILKNSH
jgi:nucleoside-triphosphatase